jgi:eukaryotic-like serine/threonine-protein kinase
MRNTIGQYRVEDVIGRGGMGVVYRGFHESLGRPVAIKALAPELTKQPEFRDRFFSEAKTQARLQHPNIVGVYDLLEEEGDYFIVMELVTGVPLDDRLQECAGRGMDVAETIAIGGQMLGALDYAHSEGVIHRDIKPSNVLIAPGGRVKLMDFGIALLIGDKRLTASQSAIGTPVYMSPEQILRPREVDHRTDIYSAGVVLHEMLAGRPPFDDDTEYGIKKLHVEAPPPALDIIRPELPAGLVQAVAVALAKAPDERFASAGLFLRSLQDAAPAPVPAAAGPLPIAAPRATTLDTGRPRQTTLDAARRATPTAAGATATWRRTLQAALGHRHARWAALAAAVVLVLGAAGLLAVFLAGGGEKTEALVEEAIEATAPDALAAGGRELEPGAERLAVGAAEAREGGVMPADPADLVAPRSLSQHIEQPREPSASPPSTRQATPRQPAAEPRAARQPERTREPEPQAEAPAPAIAEPDPTQAEPDDPPPTAAESGLDQFAEMDNLIVSIERLSGQTLEAYEAEGRDDRLLEQLDSFLEAAEEARKEFRKATGTGLAGLKANVRGILRRNRGGQETDRRILAIKVQDLSRRAGEIDRLIDSHSPGPITRELWEEVQRNLRKLDGYF